MTMDKIKALGFADGVNNFSLEIEVPKDSKRRIDEETGYLYCDEAIFGHTGVQDYYAYEIGVDGDGIVKVHRLPEDVFNDEAMASIEGKSVTRKHPTEAVNAKNYKYYDVGTILKVWKDEEKGYVVGNIVIKDMETIEDIMDHKMESLSLGYKAVLVPLGNGEYKQTNLKINHLAVVEKGRAKHARIQDEELKVEKKEGKGMGLFNFLKGKKLQFNDDDTVTVLEDELKVVRESETKSVEKESYDDVTYTTETEVKTKVTRETPDVVVKDEENKDSTTQEVEVKDKEIETKEKVDMDKEALQLVLDGFKEGLLKEVGELVKGAKEKTVFDSVNPVKVELEDEKPSLTLDFEKHEELQKLFWDKYTNPLAHESFEKFNAFRAKANAVVTR
jgi:hypothetical protein